MFVVISHIYRIFPNINLNFLNPLGYLGVGIFLFLSGYGLQCSYQRNRLTKFWKNRIVKILPALVNVTLSIVIVCWLLNKQTFTFIQIILSCIGFSNAVNSVTWYIGMLWVCYASFYLMKLASIDAIKRGWILSIAILVASILLGGAPLICGGSTLLALA